jgi:superfamily II RNA helicase
VTASASLDLNLATLLPRPGADGAEPDPDGILDAFVQWTAGQGLTLYPHQEEALLEVLAGSHVVVSTPTGSGKSLIATGAHAAALARGQRTFYTAPIKALVSEKFFALCDVFGAGRVGMLTGDATINADAPIVCATAEILANLALRRGPELDVDVVVMDEFHYYGDRDRGWAWQVPLLELTRAQFVLMSATLGDVSLISQQLQDRTGRPVAAVTGAHRPVPLSFEWVLTPLPETVELLLRGGRGPLYVVHFTQAAALEHARSLLSSPVATKDGIAAIKAETGSVRFAAGFGHGLRQLLHHGVGVHHAGMLPRYRRLVERLAQRGLLKVICGTDTLGVGINVPIRTVLLTALAKYDGRRTRLLSAREFHQIAGRAGRAGYDAEGFVAVQAPEHVIENHRALAKVKDDERKRRKLVKKKPPEGQVSWTEQTFTRLVGAEPEPLRSSFRVSHALLLNVIGRYPDGTGGDAFVEVRRLIEDSDETRVRQLQHMKRALAMTRALLDAGVVERVDTAEGRRLRLTVDLPPDFALNQPLSPFALAALDLLDRESDDYAVDVVSVIEATLDDPRPVLFAQQHQARGEAIGAMKADGIEYDERMELLEEVTWPRPLADLLEQAFDTYRTSHPWVAEYELSPKSVVRDMWERGATFAQYVRAYDLTRVEGVVLRYLADAYRALRQSVVEATRNEELEDLVEWLGEVVRQTDSSLLDEWARLADPSAVATAVEREPVDEGPPPVTRNPRAFRVLVRNAMFRRLALAAREDWTALGELDAWAGWDADTWAEALDLYFHDHDEIGTGPAARSPDLFVVDTDERGSRTWRVTQILDDPAGDRDWRIVASVDLDASDLVGEAVVRIAGVGRL